MQRIYNNIEKNIKRPKEEVYQKFCQLETWPGWFSFVSKAGFKEGNTWKTGDDFYFTVNLPVLPPIDFQLHLLSVVENEHIIWGNESKWGFQKHEFHFKDDGKGGTTLINKEWSTGHMTFINFIPGFFITYVNGHWSRDIAKSFE